jgi:hypothetical protein
VADFNEHITQCKTNLSFLVDVNSKNQNKYWDWQVTICYYTAVHIINAHLATTANLHYRTHEQVKDAIYHGNSMSLCAIPEQQYLAYAKLEGLSRRSRYLCNPESPDNIAFLTFDKHFAKAIKNLDILLTYFSNKYHVNFGNPVVRCLDLNSKTPLNIFKVGN